MNRGELQGFFRVLRWRPAGLARRGMALSCWMLLRAAAQVLVIFLLAKVLGPGPYGEFVAIVAASSFLAPFVGLGLSHLVLRNCAKDQINSAAYLGYAQRTWLWTLPVFVALSVSLAVSILPTYPTGTLLAFVVLAELSAVSLVDIYSRYWQARQRTAIYGAIGAGLPLVRLLALFVTLSCFEQEGVVAALVAYGASSLFYAAFLGFCMPFKRGKLSEYMPEPIEPRSGIPFSLAAFAMKLQAEFNKPMLAHTGFGLAGTYNVAQRTVDFASLPLLALQEVLWPRLYPQENPMRQLVRTGCALLILALVLGAVLWACAPLVPLAFGVEYADVPPTLRLLVWLPALQLIRALLNFHAIFHGRMRQIGYVYLFGGATSVIAVTSLVPSYGLVGAAVASYIAEVAMIFWLLVGVFRSSSKRVV